MAVRQATLTLMMMIMMMMMMICWVWQPEAGLQRIQTDANGEWARIVVYLSWLAWLRWC